MASLNINKGRIGYEYGYGASDVEREPIALYISSVKAEHYAPVLCQVLSVSYGGLGYFLAADPQSERTKKVN